MKMHFGLNGTFKGRATVMHGVLQRRTEGSTLDILLAFFEDHKVPTPFLRESFFYGSNLVRILLSVLKADSGTVIYEVGYDEESWGVSFRGKSSSDMDPGAVLQTSELNFSIRRICQLGDAVEFLYEVETRNFEIRIYRGFKSQKSLQEIEVKLITQAKDSYGADNALQVEYLEIGDLDYSHLMGIEYTSQDDSTADQLYNLKAAEAEKTVEVAPEKTGFMGKLGKLFGGGSEKPVEAPPESVAESPAHEPASSSESLGDVERAIQNALTKIKDPHARTAMLSVQGLLKTRIADFHRKKMQLEADLRIKDDLLRQKIQIAEQLRIQLRNISESQMLVRSKLVESQKMEIQLKRDLDARDRVARSAIEEKDRMVAAVTQMRNQMGRINQLLMQKKGMGDLAKATSAGPSPELIAAQNRVREFEGKAAHLEKENQKLMNTVRDIRRIQEQMMTETAASEKPRESDLEEQVKAATDMAINYRKETEYLKLRVEELVREETRLKLENEMLRSRMKKAA